MNLTLLSCWLKPFIGKPVILSSTAWQNSQTGTLSDVKLSADCLNLEISMISQGGSKYTYNTKELPSLLQAERIKCDGKTLHQIVLENVTELAAVLERMTLENEKDRSLARSFRNVEPFDPIEVVTDGGERLSADRILLAARSRVFSRMFQTEMREKETKQVAITAFSHSVVSIFLDIVHSRDLDLHLLQENIEQVVKLLDLYDVGCLCELTGTHPRDLVNLENVVDMLFLAGNHRQPRLLGYSWQLVRENKSQVLNSEKWKESVKAGFGGLGEKSIMALMDSN